MAAKLTFSQRRKIARDKAATVTSRPSKTDQSQARETDINVIVRRYGIHAQAPGSSREPMYGDFSGLPTDLRGFIEMAQELDVHRDRLPPSLRDVPIEELISMTPDQLTAILTPPAPPPAPTEEPKQ